MAMQSNARVQQHKELLIRRRDPSCLLTLLSLHISSLPQARQGGQPGHGHPHLPAALAAARGLRRAADRGEGTQSETAQAGEAGGGLHRCSRGQRLRPLRAAMTIPCICAMPIMTFTTHPACIIAAADLHAAPRPGVGRAAARCAARLGARLACHVDGPGPHARKPGGAPPRHQGKCGYKVGARAVCTQGLLNRGVEAV